MKRQRSILSYLQKPSLENQNSGGSSDADMLPPQFPGKQNRQNHFISEHSTVPTVKYPLPDVVGTDTPPEKLPRPVFPAKFQAIDDARPSLFSSIMHKFAKVDGLENSRERNQVDDGSFNGCSTISKNGANEGLIKQQTPSKYSQGGSTSKLSDNYGEADPLDIENFVDLLGPETPAMRPLVPRLKRVQQDFIGFDDKNVSPLFDSSKRVRSLQDPVTEKKQCTEASEANTSKFEWLNPSLIRDANGRRPGDALYDKRTLYIPPDVLRKMSASQTQYWSVKCQYMDVLLFFKVGKFYELYESDAEIAHKELDWKITFSGVGKCRQVGISESGIDDAVQKLIARGYKVGRVEQTETSDQAKARGRASVIQRKLVQVVTPSTTIDGNIGPDAVHLLALKEDNCGLENGSTVFGFAFVDCAALKFWVGSISDDASCAALGALLMQVSPREVIYQSTGLSKEAHKALKKYSSTAHMLILRFFEEMGEQELPECYWYDMTGLPRLACSSCSHLAGSTMLQLTPAPSVTDFVDSFEVRKMIHSKGYFRGSSNSWDCALDGVIHHDITISALGGLVGHLSRLMLVDVLSNGEILPYQVYKGCLRMDGQTLVNLEIFTNNADGGPAGNCVTSSGKRLLRRWICHPLKDVGEINNRLDVVEELIKHSDITFIVAQCLRKLPDLERLLGRVKAIVGSSASLLLPLLGTKVLKQRIKAFGSLIKGLRIGLDLLMILQQKEHDMSSLSKVLDVPLLYGSNGLDEFLIQFEAAIDSDFPKYQDHDVSDSDAETLSVLIELFVEKATQWSQVIHALNCIDVLRSFAVTANSSCGSMCRPVLLPVSSRSMVSCQETGGPILSTKGLWHPYAFGETGGTIVPNDIHLGEDSTGYCPRTLLLTGPNMGGKSTLLRATCLAVILAQLGCFVPCETCTLSPVDIIFTRLGATDRIMTGESTFFIECMETASVLQNATDDSLVILDELGRGTSTFDGYAIAYAVFRHLVEKVHCRLLFATHYHSLTKEFSSHPHVTLQHMACSFKPKTSSSSFKGDQELVFLYRLTSGACPESYGLQVALMAGISKKIVEVASKASRDMKASVGKNFKSSEQRSSFSTLHEDWLKTILAVSKITEECSLDEDACDTLLCLWHEMKSLYRNQIE
ncbi:DNA mismatch repair protein MutS [Macleaya cordata]|uniref:DNA mismatch repair protein MutS n=1 Tax=Macleaya cordata TaxID=56857 RepID=A0A200PNX5_MACCD|nr:DNA mismatch repair protein MutS [Macleaya cordata]